MPGAPRPRFSIALLAPRHWPAWVGVGIAHGLARLPHPLRRLTANLLGRLAAAIPGRRRRIVLRNLELCFPRMDAGQRQALGRANLRDMGAMVVELATGWFAGDRALARMPVKIEGLEHLQAAHAEGHGVLLVGGHFSHLELCARLVSSQLRIAGMYRRMDSQVFEWAVLRARLHYAEAMFDKYDLRGAVKYLRQGGALWYAPDQDMHGKDSVFVPFFGIPAATITATHHLARLGRARVIPFFHRRQPDGSYILSLRPPLENFPGPDIEADTARVNQAIEAMVREAPDQYLWAHKRFKTRPPGEPSLYPDRR